MVAQKAENLAMTSVEQTEQGKAARWAAPKALRSAGWLAATSVELKAHLTVGSKELERVALRAATLAPWKADWRAAPMAGWSDALRAVQKVGR